MESPDHHLHYTDMHYLISNGLARLLVSWEHFQPVPLTEAIPDQLHMAASEDERRSWRMPNHLLKFPGIPLVLHLDLTHTRCIWAGR